ncbi:hypothetical protein B0H14DRAFT_3139185 [Mycena olivaceomarginata]|nr:hypothetical protein B0H14DRAFT_3139185 [Mycena olivaceomarginata]
MATKATRVVAVVVAAAALEAVPVAALQLEKRKAAEDSDFEPNSPPKKKTRTPRALPEPRTLPDRKRNPDSAAPDKPRPKRPNGAKDADAAQAAAAVADREARRKALVDSLAALDAEEDAQQAQEEEDAIYHRDDEQDVVADSMDEDEPVLTITQEDFERIEDDDAYRTSPEPDKPRVDFLHSSLSNRSSEEDQEGREGETRKEVEAATRVLAEKRKVSEQGAKKKGVQNSDAAAASRKAGLSSAWAKTHGGASQAPSAAHPEEMPKLGGLKDDDAVGARPDFALAAKTRPARQNELRHRGNPQQAPQQACGSHAHRRAAVKLHKPRNTQPASKIPALVIDGCKTPKIKSESSSSSFTPESAADVRGLPAFIAPTWIGVFLPALYHLLTVSDDPMVIGSIGVDPKQSGKETVAILQTLLAETYPGNGWTMTWGDVICARAISRIGERRSAVARAGLRGADDIFKRHGPAFYKCPIPQGESMLDPEDPEYIKPRGYLESKIIIDTMTPFIKGEAFPTHHHEDENGKEVVDPSSILPIGARGMTAAAVERAYQAYRSGERVKPRDFSSQHFGTAVAGFIITSIKGLSVSRWQSIINACGANVAGALPSPRLPPRSKTRSMVSARTDVHT